MRLAISGTAHSGKTTLLKSFLHTWRNYESPSTSYRDILKEKELDHSKGTTPKIFSSEKNDVNYIKSDALNYSGFLENGRFVKISNETNNKLKRSQLKVDDILLSMAGEKLGKTAGKDLLADKTTYPKLLGMEESKKRAFDLVDKAKKAIEPWGLNAKYLIYLADFITNRDM